MASPRVLNPIVEVPGTRKEDRVGRRPSTPFSLKFKPFQLQPCAMFPVLPGETLMSQMLQAQAWSLPTDPDLRNTPWTMEYFAFYVKMRDLPGWEEGVDGLGRDLIQMFESNEALTANVDADGLAWTYCPPGGVDYLLEGTKRIVECYFREEGEAWDAATLDGVPLVKAFGRGRRDVLDRLTLASAYTDRRAAADWDASGTLTADDLPLMWQEWAAQRDGTELDMDYPDWVRAAGGRAVVKHEAVDELHEPELIAYGREFTYPTNTVEPTDGVPATAAGWRLKKQTKKMIRFPEWGWIMCYVSARPKMYYGKQQGLFAAMMQTRDNWFPPNMDPRSWSPHILIDDATGPLKAIMDTGNVDYYVNLRDLLMHGEQFINYDAASLPAGFLNLPTDAGLRRYASTTEIDSLFTDATRIIMDGVVDMNIKTYPVVTGRDEPKSLILGKW